MSEIQKYVNAALKAKAKTMPRPWTFETNAIKILPRGTSRPRSGLMDYITKLNLWPLDDESNPSRLHHHATQLCSLCYLSTS